MEEKQTSLQFLMKISYFARFFFCWLFLCKLISHQGFWCGLLSTITYPWGRNSLSHSFLSFCFSSWQADVMSSVSEIWHLDWLIVSGWQEEKKNCPILPLHEQDLAKSYPQSHIRAHDDGYLVFLESWGENPISHGFAHYSWAYTKNGHHKEKRILQHSGHSSAASSLQQMHLSETNCSGGLTSISLQTKSDGEIVFSLWWQMGEIWIYCYNFHKGMTIINTLSLVLYIYKSLYKLCLINDKSLNTLGLN